jgi:hypothetical protein
MFEQWLVANGYDKEKLSEKQLKHLEAAYKAENTPAEPTPSPPATVGFEAEMAALERENARIDRIRKMTTDSCKKVRGDSDKMKRLRAIGEAAIADQTADIRDVQLAFLREERSVGPIVFAKSEPQHDNEVIEAAICVSHKLPNVERQFPEATLEAASKAFRRGLGLQHLISLAARQNGYHGDPRDYSAMCRAAFRQRAEESWEMRADVGPSTGIQVPGILSNIANKFLASNFLYQDQSWRGFCKTRPVNDFKTVTTYRMTGANTFKKIPPGGEIKHGALSELSYTNKATTKAMMLGIGREDIINDDLGAFTSATAELGRGGADCLNNAVYTEWLDDSSFFNTDASKNNYDAGATDSVLSIAGLDNAETLFMLQTKPDGTPLGSMPRILLVPSSLKNTALALMTPGPTNLATSSVPVYSQANVFADRYRVVSTPYLQRTSLPDGDGISQTVTGSSTAWYLLADPMDLAAIEVCFLFGQETPTVETSEFDFDRLGMAMRAYFDFGVSKQEYRAAVKLKGAA